MAWLVLTAVVVLVVGFVVAAYVRRWAIRPLPTNPNNTLIIQVLVSPQADELARQANTTGARRRQPGDALITSVKTRKAR